jgi:hypothetical protein
MRYVWLVLAFAGVLVVGLLVGITLGRGGTGEQGSAPSPQTVTVEETVPARTTPNPTTTPVPPSTAPAQTVGSLEDARAAFERAVEGYGNPNLEVAEVMEFANNYYAEVREKDTGIGAMELLIDKPYGTVYPEPGPNMMWNAKYGMMAGRGYRGMMGPGGRGMMGPNSAGQVRPGAFAEQMTVSPEQAREIADAYVRRVSPGTQAGEAEPFYGYYTLHTEKDGEVTGMLSVNGYSGEVWYHSWHGPFIAMEEE